MGSVIIRTHGGLGNQLFQLLYGRLLAHSRGLDVREVHDDGYYHKFARADKPKVAMHPTAVQATLSRLRFPKIFNRLLKFKETHIKIGRDFYIDGYFQDEQVYRSFQRELIKRQLQTLALELDSKPAN